MPPIKTNSTQNLNKCNKTRKPVANAYSLISKMLQYEDAACKNNIDFNSSRFKMLTASERDYLRAELIADYIRLCASNTGNNPSLFDSSLFSFCSKICELELPTNELLGTYLAALEVAGEDRLEDRIENMNEIIKKTMFSVLHTTVEMIAHKTGSAIAKPKLAGNL